ncbi:MAG: PEP-CTERM system histidine kinase PrsK [Burkholderiales bacterium]|nr:PEP-CTERM system histidine kinase PrsK [Burkholderiales bacterium]
MGDTTLSIGAVSYGIAAVAFVLLTGLLVSGWRGKFQGALLAAAAGVTALWAGLSAYASAAAGALSAFADLLEIARDGLWLLFLWRLLVSRALSEDIPTHQRMKRWFGFVTFVFAVIFITTLALHTHLLAFSAQGTFITVIIGRVVLAVIGLALVEQLYRNAPEAQRWAIKYFCLGLGALFAYDFYLYSDAMLFRVADAGIWSARGFINALVVPLIAVSAARNPHWSLDVHVSRRVVFHSAALFGAGAYLLVMAGVGYYIRLFGGNWGGVLQVAFLFGAAVILLAVLFSGALRARLKVFLSKHFFNYKYDYREEWLRFTHTLSAGEPGLKLRQRSLQAVAELVDSPAAALWVEEAGVFRQVAQWNLPALSDIEDEHCSLCRFLAERQWVVNLKEYANEPDIYGELRLPVWMSSLPRAWLVTPLILHEQLMGFIVLTESRSPREFNWEDSDLLKTAGRQVAVYLAQIQATESLVQARQFESFNRLSTYVVHDLKNIVAQLSLLLANAQKHKHNPEFQEDMLTTVDNAAQRMTRLLAQLRTGYQSAQQATGVDLISLLERLMKEKAHFRPVPQLTAPSQPVWVIADKERLSRVLGHLVQNAIEATPETGAVSVVLETQDENARITVQDNGRGMDEEFMREKLFRPFETTKITGMGIGAYECREYVRELRGEIHVTSHVNLGTTFTVTLPQRRSVAQEEKEQSPMQGATGA